MADRPDSCVYIATSLDGFIARPDGNIDWLHEADTIEGEDFGYRAFFDSVDALVMGRRTLQSIQDFTPWPYENKRVLVLSNTLQAPPAHLQDKIEIVSLAPEDLVRQLGQDGCRRIYVDGGETIRGFLRQGLISEITITTIPILLGQGRPLFGPIPEDLHLQHIATRSWENGFVQSSYRIAGSTPDQDDTTARRD